MATPTQFNHIAIAGAGSIGCYLGGALLAAGRSVSFLARERIQTELQTHGLRVTDYTDFDEHLEASSLEISTSPEILAKADLILVTVKSSATAEMGQLIDTHANPNATVVSFQNGVSNADTLRANIRDRRVAAGMVPFNVVNLGDGHFHRGTSGDLIAESGIAGLSATLNSNALDFVENDDMPSVMWGKLLINLNNALNALSGIPLKQQLESASWRRLAADQFAEALAVLDAAGITPAKALPLPPRWVPALMRLPTPLFRMVAASMLKIDPTARSSMWEDLQRGRTTEIDQLQGACVAVANSVGLSAPVCERVTALIRDAEAAGQGSPGLAPDYVRAGIR